MGNLYQQHLIDQLQTALNESPEDETFDQIVNEAFASLPERQLGPIYDLIEEAQLRIIESI